MFSTNLITWLKAFQKHVSFKVITVGNIASMKTKYLLMYSVLSAQSLMNHKFSSRGRRDTSLAYHICFATHKNDPK